MRLKLMYLVALIGVVLALVGWQLPDGGIDDAGLKTMVTNLGYTPKDLGEGTLEIALTTTHLNIPTRMFLSKSKLKLWLSVTLALKDGVAKFTRDDLQKILETNVDIGPAHFMIEGGSLKVKLPIDNRGLTPAVLRKELDYLSARVDETRAVWQKP